MSGFNGSTQGADTPVSTCIGSNISDPLSAPQYATGSTNEICIASTDGASSQPMCDVHYCDAAPADYDESESCNTNELVSKQNSLCSHKNRPKRCTTAENRVSVEYVGNVNDSTEIHESGISSSCKLVAGQVNNDVYVLDSFTETRSAQSTCTGHVDSSLTNGTENVSSVSKRCVDDDDLLAELESEFCSGADALVQDLESGFAGQRVANDNCDDLTKDILMLRRRQKALEYRLESTLESRKQLEVENIRLEQKLMTANGSLEVAYNEMTSLNTELELRVQEHQKVVSEWAELLKQQEENGRQAIEELRTEYQLQIDQMTRAYEDQLHEKDGVVVRYAQAEQRNIELNDRIQKAELKIREWTKERDVALGKWKTLKEEKVKLSEVCDSKTSELSSLKKEVEKLKDAVSSSDIKIKWHQNKLKAEQDALKECKLNHEKTERTLKDMTKDFQRLWEQLRAFYMVIQNAENNSSSHHVRMEECKTVNAEEVCSLMRKDFSTLSWKIREVMEELRTYKDKVHCLEAERLSQDNALSAVREDLQSHQNTNTCLRDRISQLEQTESALLDVTVQFTMASQRTVELEKTKSELEAEIDKLRLREGENLELTSRLSEKNSSLQAENTHLQLQIDTLSNDFKSCSEQLAVLQEKFLNLETEMNNVKSSSEETIDRLEKLLTEQQGHVDASKQRVDELESEIKILKRRHSNNIKDLLRQLQQANRKMGMENGTTVSGTADNMSMGSIGSHGGSCGSLDTAGLYTATSSDHAASHAPDSPSSVKESTVTNTGEVLNVDELQALRRAVARKNEKIEFLKDHVDHLVEELNRKSNIIRGNLMRDEGGALAPESSDRNKAQLSKKGGIMASLYNTQTMDSGMTLGLSLEINHKLQALLEDTLLKNIKLKEGMDTLGKEIDWLMRENNRLKSDAASLVNSEEFPVSLEDHS